MFMLIESDMPNVMNGVAANAIELLRSRAIHDGDDGRAIVLSAYHRGLPYLQAGQITLRQLNLYVFGCMARFNEADEAMAIGGFMGFVMALAPDQADTMLPEAEDVMRLRSLGLWPW